MSSNLSYLKQLVYITKSEPIISSCIRRIRNYCLIDGFTIQERFQPLDSKFQNSIRDAFMAFLQNTLDLYFMCGFVPFVVRKQNGVFVPMALPLGTFTWTVEPAPERSSKILQYKVRIIKGNVKEEDVKIHEMVTPAGVVDELQSPLAALLEHHMRLQEVLNVSVAIEKHNAQKHILISETIDLKDQTTNGIMLLDEFRRYNISGWHPAAAQATALRMKTINGGAKTQSVNDANMHWVQSQFEDDKSVHATMLPPNMSVTELQNIRRENDLEQERNHWSSLVHSFFDIPSPEAPQGKVNSAEANLLSREQFTNIRYICDMLERVVETAYKECYETKHHVVCKIDPQSRLSVNTTEDVKKLVESGMLDPSDKNRVRQMFMPSAKRVKA